MKILGIESSCDDTSVAIVDSNKKILSNETVSQNNIHQLYKGVVPELAARNHVLHIDKITKKALINANLSLQDINGVAATAGPGLIGGLLVGLSFAKTIAQVKNTIYSSESSFFRPCSYSKANKWYRISLFITFDIRRAFLFLLHERYK